MIARSPDDAANSPNQRLQRVVHISADVPDLVDDTKTPVITRLVDLVGDRFDQHLVSLNRVSPGLVAGMWPSLDFEVIARNRDRTCLKYRAPPAGLHHWRMLNQLGERLAEMLADFAPDIIVAHKLTVEGIAAARAAEILAVPLAISIQGNTDIKIMDVRRDLRRGFARIYQEAAVVFPFAPWAQREVEKRLGRRSGNVVPLPCALASDEWLPPQPNGQGLVTAFHLRNAALKNLPRMAHAVTLAKKTDRAIRLDVIGGGNQEETSAAEAMIGEGVRLLGPLPNTRIRGVFNRSRGFCMPSLRESFGLVFIEALQAGLPIIYPAGAGVDGWFDDCPFAIRVDARDTAALSAAMLKLHHEEARLKSDLAAWQESSHARRFTRPSIAEAFAQGLASALDEKRT